MTHPNRSPDSNQSVDRIVEQAIASQVGDIEALPPEVATRLKAVYREFMPAYVEIIRVKEKHSIAWQPQQIVPDPDVVEDMLHFFSDYQNLARRFKQINRQVNNLLKIDRRADRQRFERCVAEIVSGTPDTSLMDSLVDS